MKDFLQSRATLAALLRAGTARSFRSAVGAALLFALATRSASGADGMNNTNHWAFKTPIRPPVPQVKNLKWPRTPIDNFVLARLEKEGLNPAPEAERSVLLRRLSLDLTGLPPRLQEIEDWLGDNSPEAYTKIVERLLASPHYGERWGRHWLDAARYADSNGFEKDAKRSIWPYRDWVIDSFNRDVPYDRFTIEQLAGDLLPGATLEQRIATGFLRNSMLNQEGGIEPEQFRIEAMIDRMDAVGRTWLGLTIACAQCHNHKYDPIAQKEYYGFFAFLNNDDEPAIEVPTAAQQKERDRIVAAVHELEDKNLRENSSLAPRLATWEDQLRNDQTQWSVLEPKEWLNFATKFEKQSDFSLLGGGDVKPGGTMKVWVDTLLTNITAFRLDLLTHPNLPYGGPGQVAKGNFLLKEITVEAYPANNPGPTNRVKFSSALSDAEAPGFAVTNAIDGNTAKGGWSADFGPLRRNRDRVAVFQCAEPLAGFPGGTRLLITLHETHSNGDGHNGAPDKDSKLDSHMIGRFRLSATTNAGALAAPITTFERQLLATPRESRSPADARELYHLFRQADPSFAAFNKRVDDLSTNWPYAATTLTLQARAEPRATHLFSRGDWQRPREVVEPDVPAILHPFPKDAPRNRLGLAKWLVDRRSPTTARVIVNRVWHAYFGQGLVTTPEDFGTRVEAPSHPELLDWLACEFMDRGWSFKELHRLIVNSACYRQSSKVAPDLYTRDQYNRLLARGPRFRVEAEIVQDIALAASGLLNLKIGGPSVYPPIPASVADQVYGGFSWPESKGEDRYRRGLYTFWKRASPFPALLAFDEPTSENSCTRRARSNTPLQALTTLNERTFVDAAQALGLRVLKEGGRDERSRAIYAFRLCTGRIPSDSELEALVKFWQEQYAYFEDRTADAVKVAVANVEQLPPDVNLHKAAAWTMVSRAILNLDETITKE